MNSIAWTDKSVERFWRHVDVKGLDDCWEWSPVSEKARYGHFHVGMNGKDEFYELSHRASWILHFGDIPKEMYVCHRCDNTRCVNPRHLFLGTANDNTQDMIRKGRYNCPKGEEQYKAKLTERDVATVKDMLSKGISYRSIARTFEVKHATIGDIAKGRTWKHLKIER